MKRQTEGIHKIAARKGLDQAGTHLETLALDRIPTLRIRIKHHDQAIQTGPTLKQPLCQSVATRRGHRRLHENPVIGGIELARHLKHFLYRNTTVGLPDVQPQGAQLGSETTSQGGIPNT